ncbi:MAG: hypothetical protein KDA85_17845, partial [Planctomycetaceae bacterium]|nr:hypothetical protein [Planctomycetaceae bacterium]
MSQLPADGSAMFPGRNDEDAGSLDIFGFLRRRKAFIILFGMLGTGIGFLLLQRAEPLYEATAQV